MLPAYTQCQVTNIWKKRKQRKLSELSCARQKQVLTSRCACPALQSLVHRPRIEKSCKGKILAGTSLPLPYLYATSQFPLLSLVHVIAASSYPARSTCTGKHERLKAWPSHALRATVFPFAWTECRILTGDVQKQKEKFSLQCFRCDFGRIWRGSRFFHLSQFFGSAAFRPCRYLNLWTSFSYSRTVRKK